MFKPLLESRQVNLVFEKRSENCLKRLPVKSFSGLEQISTQPNFAQFKDKELFGNSYWLRINPSLIR